MRRGARSSLSRALAASGTTPESALADAELATHDAAADWDPHYAPTIGLLAELQHAGAPTRLLNRGGTTTGGEAGWGTGVKTWWWLPPTTNERLRAQRGGFRLEAEPIVPEEIAGVFARRLGSGGTWGAP